MGINGAKGKTLNMIRIGVIIGGNVNAFWDKFKRKKIYYRKIFGGETHNGVLHKYT